MTPDTTVDYEEIAAITDVALDPARLTTKLILSQVNKRDPRLAFHMAEYLGAMCGSIDAKQPPVSPGLFHYLIGNLSAIELEVCGDKSKESYVRECVAALAAGTEGERSAHWQRIHRLLNWQNTGESDSRGRKGTVATVDDAARKGTKRQTNNLKTLIDLTALNTSIGLDALSAPETNRVRTLSTAEPITIAFGAGTDEDTIRLASDRRGHTCITSVWHEPDGREVRQYSMEDEDAAFIGHAYDLTRCFGKKLKTILTLPTSIDLGEQPTASWLTIVRTRGRIAILIRRPRGTMTIEQGDDLWRFDPSAVHEDTFGTLNYLPQKTNLEALGLSADEDGEDEDTVLES